MIIGGSKGKAFERVARHGDGWYAPSQNIEQMTDLMKKLNEACEEIGRDPAGVDVSAMWIPAMEGTDVVKRYEEIGVDRLIVPIFALGAPTPETLEKFGEDFVSKV